jgi:hypothetical protein
MVSNIFASKAQPKATRDALDVACPYSKLQKAKKT